MAYFSDVPLPGGVHFDAGLPLALITLAVLGPLPALLVDLAPMAVGGLVGRTRILRTGTAANVAAWGWEAVAAAALLSAVGAASLGADALPWLAARRRRHVLRELLDRTRRLPAAAPRPPRVDAAADVRRHTADGAGHGRARRVHRRARRAARRARAGALRPDRRTAAERAHLRGTHAPGREGWIRSPPRAATRTRSRCTSGSIAPSAAISRASRSSRSPAAPTPATRSPTPARRCATRAARAGRPGTSASGGTAAAARPGCAAR